MCIILCSKKDEFFSHGERELGDAYELAHCDLGSIPAEAGAMARAVSNLVNARGAKRVRAIVLDRELFVAEGRGRFDSIQLLKRRLQKRARPVVVLVTLTPEADFLEALESGARMVVSADFSHVRFIEELNAAHRHDCEQRRAQRAYKDRAVLRGFVIGACTVVVGPLVCNLLTSTLMWLITSSGGAWIARVIPGPCDDHGMHGTLQIDTDPGGKSVLRVVELPRVDGLAYCGIELGQCVTISERGPTMLPFYLRIAPEHRKDVEEMATRGELWIGVSGPGFPEGSPKRLTLGPLWAGLSHE